MLIQFNFKNYKSFRDASSLDMTATKITEHPSHVVTAGGDKLLSVAAIYGANASGKSNVYEAFAFMKDYVSNSFGYGREGEIDIADRNKTVPFLFDTDSRNAESEFEVFFMDPTDEKERTYQYGFCLLGTEVIEEWLYSKAKSSRNDYRTIFYRKKGEDFISDGIPKKAAENLLISLEPETLAVSLGAKLKIRKLQLVRDWFMKHEVMDFGSPAENFFRFALLPKGFVRDKSVQDNVTRYLSAFDESIIGFEIEEVRTLEEKVEKVYRINALHKLAGSDKVQSIPLQNESSGTLKMFALYPALRSVFEHGSLLVVDELNARLHPLLVRNIILSFLSPDINPNHAQLVMTTHDIWQFSNEFLRRDELWMTDKTKEGVSTLYSVADFKDEDGNKARRNEALAKRYLLGNYGGIPALKPLNMLGKGGADGEKE